MLIRIVYISVFAYGKNRFEMTFNPCGANIFRYIETFFED